MYYYGARYYDPAIARFISADSIVASPYDPQDLNRYAYTRNNPITYVDPTGHGFFKKWFPVIIAIAAAAITAGAMAAATTVIPLGFGASVTVPTFSALQIGLAAGAVGGAVGGLASGGGLQGALVGAGIGAVAGVAGGWAGGAAGGGFAGAVVGGAVGGGVGGALSAVVSGQNVFEGAIIGAATGAAFAAAMYGVVQAIRGAKQQDQVLIRGEKDSPNPLKRIKYGKLSDVEKQLIDGDKRWAENLAAKSAEELSQLQDLGTRIQEQITGGPNAKGKIIVDPKQLKHVPLIKNEFSSTIPETGGFVIHPATQSGLPGTVGGKTFIPSSDALQGVRALFLEGDFQTLTLVSPNLPKAVILGTYEQFLIGHPEQSLPHNYFK